MRVLIIDKSELARNIYAIALEERGVELEYVHHLEDLRVLRREGRTYDAVILNENFLKRDDPELNALVTPQTRGIKKILVSKGQEKIDGFDLLKRPFHPTELLKKLGLAKHASPPPSKGRKEEKAPAHDRRLFERKSLKTKIYFEDELGDPLIWLRGQNISLGGLLIMGDLNIKKGSALFISFSLPGVEEVIKVTGEVVRLDPSPPGGMGVRFIGLAPRAQRVVESYLALK